MTSNLHAAPIHDINFALAPEDGQEAVWFVMRASLDKRVGPDGQRLYGWENIKNLVYERFIPVKEDVRQVRGKKKRVVSPIASDLIFVHDTYDRLKSLHDSSIGIQFRYVKGAPYQAPLSVRAEEMENFIVVCENASSLQFFASGIGEDSDVTRIRRGNEVRIEGGPFDGCVGTLLTVRGSRKRRLQVQIRDLGLSAVVEIDLNGIVIQDLGKK